MGNGDWETIGKQKEVMEHLEHMYAKGQSRKLVKRTGITSIIIEGYLKNENKEGLSTVSCYNFFNSCIT